MNRRARPLILIAWLFAAANAIGADVVIRNGLAPPDPANVLDASDDPDEPWWIVRNVDCGTRDPIEHPCLSPGAPTAFELQGGRTQYVSLSIYDTSSLNVVGAIARDLIYAYDSASITIGPNVQQLDSVELRDMASATVDGATFGGLDASGSAHLSVTDTTLEGLGVEDAATATMTGGSAVFATVRGVATFQDTDVGKLTAGPGTVSMTGGTLGGLSLGSDGHLSLDHVAIGEIKEASGTGSLDLTDCTVQHQFITAGTVDVHGTRVAAEQVDSNNSSTIQLESSPISGIARVRDSSRLELVDSSVGDLDGYGSIHLLRGTANGYSRAIGSATLDWDGAIGGAFPVRVFNAATLKLRSGSAWQVVASDSAWVDQQGGAIERALYVQQGAIATLRGGSIGFDTDADQNGTLVISGGHIDRYLSARGAASVAIRGTNFAVDGVPIPYGPLPVPHGVLTGTLASGEPISNEFFHAGSQPPHLFGLATGTIRVPEPDAARLAFAALLALGRVAASSRKAR